MIDVQVVHKAKRDEEREREKRKLSRRRNEPDGSKASEMGADEEKSMREEGQTEEKLETRI